MSSSLGCCDLTALSHDPYVWTRKWFVHAVTPPCWRWGRAEVMRVIKPLRGTKATASR